MLSGRRLALSAPRRLVNDFLALSRGIPLIPIERTMRLSEVAAARRWYSNRSPSWTAIFLKAYGIVSQRHPELRRAFVPRPWSHLYEHHETVAAVAVERLLDGEPIVLPGMVRNPGLQSLAALDRFVEQWKCAPLLEIDSFRRAIRLARYSWPTRALCYELLRWSGRHRCRDLGTFGISTTATHGAATLALVSPLTTTLHYGLLDDQGSLPMRLTFDHRVVDGAWVARILVEFENVLLTDVLEELRCASAA